MARQSAGPNGRPLSYNDLRDEVLIRLGKALTPTAETLRRMHTGSATNLDPVVVAAIADVYGMTLEELAPDMLAHARSIDALLRKVIKSRCFLPTARRPLPAGSNSVAARAA
jgi:hypothetical protein